MWLGVILQKLGQIEGLSLSRKTSSPVKKGLFSEDDTASWATHTFGGGSFVQRMSVRRLSIISSRRLVRKVELSQINRCEVSRQFLEPFFE